MYNTLLKDQKLKFDSKMFYMWYSSILNKKGCICRETIIAFFEENFLKNPSLVHAIDTKGFQCVAKMFLLLNDCKNKMDVNSFDGEISLSEFVVHVDPS